MKKTTKLLLTLAAVTLLGALLALSSFAEIYTGDCGADGNNLTYTFDTETGVLFITGIGDMKNYEVDDSGWSPIWRPGAPTEATIVSPWSAFKNNVKIVIIDDMVANIGNYAFYGFSSLTSVTIPDSVTSTGNYAFYNCSSLTSVTIPDSVTSIGFSAFEYCSSLTSVTIPDSVTSIGNKAFSWCSSLTSVTIPDSVTSIGDWAFGGCSSLTSVTFETKNATFDSNVFNNCSKLKTIYLYRNSTANAYFSSSYTKKYLDLHTISFDLNGGIGVFEEQIKKECEPLVDSVPMSTKEGYVFDVWSDPDGNTYSAGGDCSVEGDITLTATWKEATYNVTYDANGGSGAPSSQTKYYFSELTLSDKVPTRTGYNFGGWSGSDGKTYSAGDTYSTNADITLTAIWEIKVYNITYDANGGENAPEGSTKEHFETVNLSEVIPTKHGYNFGSWSGSDGKTYAAGGACSANQDLVLTAIWQEKTYTVTYDANGGSGAPSSQTKYYFTELTLSDKVPTRTGYNFGGWSGSDGKTYSAGDTYSTNADITLTAIWEIKVYNITYDANGGENAPEGSTKEHFETVNLSEVIPTKHGYNFGGWRGSDGMTYSAGGACSVNTDIVLTAIWNPMAVTLIYDANGGNVYPSSKTVYYEENYGTLANPTRVGYTFAGWYTEKDGGSRVSSSTYVNTIENITIFAHWSANSYSVSFDANGGTISDGSKRVVFDSEYGTLPTPVLAGFTFDGWYTAIEGGARITDTTIVKNAADHTLYAHWKGASYLLILDANGGKCTPDSKNVDFGEKYGELPVPTRAGYKFITWSKTKSESGAVNADTVHNSISDATLYAVWAKLGDPNGDDIIDTKDAVLLAQFLAKWDVEIDPISADCNGDGVLDTKDAVLLAQYLAKWDVTLGK